MGGRVRVWAGVLDKFLSVVCIDLKKMTAVMLMEDNELSVYILCDIYIHIYIYI